jgi:hypothetical protein
VFPFTLNSSHRLRPNPPSQWRRRSRLETLEQRRVLATFLVTTTSDAGPGSLRQAIVDANGAANTGAPDRIEFDIAGSGPHSISVSSGPLDSISDAVVIDGFTQPGAVANSNPIDQPSNAVHQIQINGQPTFDGLTLLGSGGSTIQGLVISNFDAGVFVNSSNNIVQGSLIGTGIDGSTSAGNRVGVLVLDGSSNTIGGSSAASRNVISGNLGDGIFLGTSFSSAGVSSSNTVEGNYIGTDPTGNNALENQGYGVQISSGVDNTVGGSVGNVISGNQLGGVLIGTTLPGGDATRNIVIGNHIGTDRTGVSGIANSIAGVILTHSASANTIGQIGVGEENVIAFNDGPGVLIAPSSSGNPTANSIRGNLIFSNAGLGIDLSAASFPNSPDLVTINDPNDSDTGPNELQNYPVLRRAVSNGETRLIGFLDSTPNSTFEIDFYENRVPDPSGNGEGQLRLGSTTVTTDSFGSVDFDISGLPMTSGTSFITSTATNAAGSTSEFSSAVDVLQLSSISGFKFDDSNGDGDNENGSDPGVGGVTIILTGDTNGDGPIDVSFSDVTSPVDGSYSFPNLVPGVYTVTELTPPDTVTTTGDSVTFTVQEGTQYVATATASQPNPVVVPGLAFGNFRTISISGTKFNDFDGDGNRDPGEPGISGFTIFLDDNGDGQLDPGETRVVTGSDGNYVFNALGPGNYLLREVQQSGFRQTTPDPGPIMAISGNNVFNVDFGNQAFSSISGFKFDDTNGNGNDENGSDPRVGGVTINLVGDTNGDGSNDVFRVATTQSVDGSYSFGSLRAGLYTVTELTPTGTVTTTGASVTITVQAGTQYVAAPTTSDPNPVVVPGLAFGNFRTISISGTKFNDFDGDGNRDPSEPGISGFTIFLDDNDDGDLDPGEQSTVTTSDGSYVFASLDPGNYLVREVQQAGFIQTTPNPDPIMAFSGSNVLGVDFGNRSGLGSISGTKFSDENQNGLLDPGEQELQGFRVYSDENGNGEFDPGERFAFTDSNGRYTIDNLVAGRYQIAEVQRPGFVQTAPPSGFLDPIALPATGGYVTSVVNGDFNNDGIADLASTNDAVNTVSIMLGNGDGTFSQSQVGVGVRPLKVATIQRGGLNHLAVITSGNASQPSGDEDRLSFLINQGNGSFVHSATYLGVGNGALDLAVGDVNHDGLSDIAVSNFRSNEITLLIANGTLSFTESRISVGTDPVDVDLVDFDGDNDLDVVVANSGSNTVSLLSNLGNGTFVPNRTLQAGSGPSAVELGDVNGDGQIDLVVANYLSNNVFLYLNFGSSSSFQIVPVGARPKDISLGDIDVDGRTEIAVANSEVSQFTYIDVADNNVTATTSVPSGGGASSIVIADFNEDGLNDLALSTFVAQPVGSRVSLILNSAGIHVVDLLAGEMRDNVDFGNHQFVPIAMDDFGDAPNSYGTTIAADGASHGITAGLNIGATVDREIDGQPNISATGDDINGDDEDGVRLLSPLGPGDTATFEVTISNTSGSAAFLQAFLDFNRDGDFTDVGEKFASDIPVPIGSVGSVIPVTVSVPSGASVGTTYARFRLSQTSGLGPAGFATTGEVEDYSFPIAPASDALQNINLPLDVNNDGSVSTIDALLIINTMNRQAVTEGESISNRQYYTDVNGDQRISAVDALQVINYLATQSNLAPSGEELALPSRAQRILPCIPTDEVYNNFDCPEKVVSIDAPRTWIAESISVSAGSAPSDGGSDPLLDTVDLLAKDLARDWN